MLRALLGIAVLGIGCAFEPGQGPDVGDDPGGGGGSEDPAGQDSDGDGVLDASDNCALVGNSEQRDHDDDGRGDACDVCPHAIDAGDDGDGDGVGDACDPRPTLAGDRIAYFETFETPPSWDTVIGGDTWSIGGGLLEQPDVEAAHQLVRDDDPNLKSVLVVTRVRVNAVSTNATSRRSMGLVLNYRDDDDYLFCGLAAQGQSAELDVGQVDTDFWGNARFTYNASAFAATMTGEWLTVQARTVRVDGDTTRIECATHRSGVSADATFDADAKLGGDVGLRTNGTDASFDYVFVVESPS